MLYNDCTFAAKTGQSILFRFSCRLSKFWNMHNNGSPWCYSSIRLVRTKMERSSNLWWVRVPRHRERVQDRNTWEFPKTTFGQCFILCWWLFSLPNFSYKLPIWIQIVWFEFYFYFHIPYVLKQETLSYHQA